MAAVSGCSTCGEYPASLFKTSNELQGVETQSSSERFANKLAEDKVTLSSDALSLARAELRTQGGNPTTATSSEPNNKDRTDGLAQFNSGPQTTFYTTA